MFYKFFLPKPNLWNITHIKCPTSSPANKDSDEEIQEVCAEKMSLSVLGVKEYVVLNYLLNNVMSWAKLNSPS